MHSNEGRAMMLQQVVFRSNVIYGGFVRGGVFLSFCNFSEGHSEVSESFLHARIKASGHGSLGLQLPLSQPSVHRHSLAPTSS